MKLTCLETTVRQLNLFAEIYYEPVSTQNLPLLDVVKKSPIRGLILVGPGEHFGLQIAKKFGREGFKVGLIGRSEDRLSKMVRTLEESGISAYYACADVRDIQQLRNAFNQLTKQIPQFQCLIYNVKHSIKGHALKLTSAQLTETFDVNVSGAISTIQISLPMMKMTTDLEKHPSIAPTIILTGGGYKDRPDANKLSLSIGKSGIHTVFTVLRQQLSYSGITLKTLVIDGAVRETGSSLRSDDVAERFWTVFASPPNKHFFRFPVKMSKDHNPDQLELQFSGSTGSPVEGHCI